MTTHASVAARPHDAAQRAAAKQALRYPPVRFDDRQIKIVGAAFGEAVAKAHIDIFACAVLHNHVHMVLGPHRHPVEQICNFLKGMASGALSAEGRHPMSRYPDADGKVPSPWGRGQWKVFLNGEADVHRAVRYVEGNLAKEGLERQEWAFVKEFAYRPDRRLEGRR